ncbi:MAG: hypothetical protein WC002_02025 [Candidatus Muiribacteriota bacterium]|jgi:hypothetical protein
MKDNKYFLDYENEKLIAYSKLSVEDKLQWLEDALLFNEQVFNQEDKKIREKMIKYINNQK